MNNENYVAELVPEAPDWARQLLATTLNSRDAAIKELRTQLEAAQKDLACTKKLYHEVGEKWSRKVTECYRLTARVKALEGLGELLANVRRHRDVPCSESHKCPGESCGVAAHNHIIYKTRQSRDDAEALFQAIDAALAREGGGNG